VTIYIRGIIPSNVHNLHIVTDHKKLPMIILPSNLTIIQIHIPLLAVNMHLQLK